LCAPGIYVVRKKVVIDLPSTMLLIYITIGLFLLYAVIIIYYWLGWVSIPNFCPSAKNNSLPISVIIPARNEEENIGQLLAALQEQTYPKELTEIIVIDDHSTDATSQIVQSYPNTRLITLNEENINSYKKKAIETGIAAATGKLIITTDADCAPRPEWLQTLVSFKEERNSAFVAAPVSINCNSTLVQIFQAMDFMVLQGITGAAVQKNFHAMCNGANLAYERDAFYSVNGFSGVDNIASGDDMLLMHKIWKAFPGRVHYLRSQDSIVSTQPTNNWKEFFSQRIRWASKTRFYKDKSIVAVLSLVYLFNLLFLVLLIAGFWNIVYWKWLLGLWFAKTLVELPLFINVAKFFGKKWAIPWFVFFQPIHVAYTIIAGFFSQWDSYSWKGRTVK
jgi:poly-beta-1,6-N-acetyl-D-glucosamine synthase